MTMKLSRLLLSTVLVLATLSGILLSRPAPVSAAGPWYVATTGSDVTGTGTSANPWQTIQHAIDDAGVGLVPGEIINIAAGNYVEQVTITTKSLTLVGTPAYTTVIVAPPTATPRTLVTIGGNIWDYIVAAYNLSGTLNVRLFNIVVTANGTSMSGGANRYAGVVFDNVTGSGAGFFSSVVTGLGGTAGIDNHDGIAVLGDSSLTISDSDIDSFKAVGIWSWGGTGGNPRTTIANSYIEGVAGTTGIRYLSSRGTVNHNTITGGITTGVISTDMSSFTVIDNDIYNAGRGLHIQDCSGPVFIGDNYIHSITGDGIFNDSPVSAGSIAGNSITTCNRGIALTRAAASPWDSINGNFIYTCTTAGIYTENTTLPIVSQNYINNCGTGIDVHTTLLTAHCNAIFGNATAGLRLWEDGLFNVTENYWGANGGPNVDGGGPGTGDRITRNGHTALTYNPWVVITVTAAPATLVADGTSTSTITMDLTKNSAGVPTSCIIPDGLGVTFATSLGGFGGASTINTITSAARASAPLSSTNAGTATVTTRFQLSPTAIGTTQVVFTAPPTPVNPLVGTGAPTTHGSSVIGPAASTPTVLLPSIQTQSASLSAKTVTPGAPVTVTADIANKSAVNGNKKVTLYVNGQVETTQGITVNSGGSTKLTFNVSRSEPGDYSVYVDGVPAGSFKVELFRESDGILIFSAVLLALAFLIGVVMLWRRQQRTG